ncbi:hypothetical protein FQA39_LY08937 [Lamprigera yunnana]|nr:hypothetical protein FQA39_LY08937 [Lamprigera yunnana]
METRWYVDPGQTLEKTKIDERSLALHVSQDSWNSLLRHLSQKQRMQEAIDLQITQKESLKKGSEEMTRHWDNSVENIRKRKEDERLARIQRKEQAKLDAFYKLRSGQEALRQKYIAEARRKIYLAKGHPKNLTGALILSEVLYERQKQIELEKKISKQEQEELDKYAQFIVDGAMEEKATNEAYQQKLENNKKEMKEIYLKDIAKREEERRKEKNERLKQEQKDITEMQEELKKQKQYQDEEDREKKNNVKEQFHKFQKETNDTKEILRLEELEVDKVINIYNTAKHKMHCLRKRTEKNLQAKKETKSAKVGEISVSIAKAREKEEERVLKNAMKEKEELALEKVLAEEKYQQQLVRERIEEQEKFLMKEKQRREKEAEIKKWQMLNRFKTHKANAEYDTEKARKEWQLKLENRRQLFAQIAEKEEAIVKEKEIDNLILNEAKQKITDEDEQFFEYVDEVMDYAKNKGRSIEPIERYINEYKKENGLPRPLFKACKNYHIEQKQKFRR